MLDLDLLYADIFIIYTILCHCLLFSISFLVFFGFISLTDSVLSLTSAKEWSLLLVMSCVSGSTGFVCSKYYFSVCCGTKLIICNVCLSEYFSTSVVIVWIMLIMCCLISVMTKSPTSDIIASTHCTLVYNSLDTTHFPQSPCICHYHVVTSHPILHL